MSTDEYVPSEAQLRTAWSDYCQSMDACNAWVRPDDVDPRAEFDRFLARVRRDAAREALDELIAHADLLAERAGENRTAQCIWQTVAGFAEGKRDTRYPEETP